MFLAGTVAACGGDDGGDDGGVNIPDAGPSDGVDSGGGDTDGGGGADGECLFDTPVQEPAQFVAVLLNQDDTMPEGPQWILAGAFLDAAQQDFLGITMWDGFGVFADGFAPGTYELTGAEASYLDCGACVAIEADGSGDVPPEQILQASGGTLEITAIEAENGGSLQATLTGATLRELAVDFEAGTETEVAGGCEVTLPTITLDLTIQDPDAEGGGM